MAIENRSLSLSKKITFTLILVLLPVFFVLLIGEIVLRINPTPVTDPLPGPPYNTRELDDTLGWHVKGDYSHDGMMKDLKGNEYPIHISFNKDGFRSYPQNTSGERLKIFLVGDSYTEDLEVSDDKTWYSLLSQKLPVDIYAYGSAGYGTMQEFLILQKYFDQIKPDIVLLQTCTNDFSDNYCKLEKETAYKVGQCRPYMNEGGKVYYDRAWIGHKHLRSYSYFLYYLATKYDNMKMKMTGKPPEYHGEGMIVEQELKYPPFKESVEVTGLIIQKMSEYLEGKARFAVFTADSYPPAMPTLRSICEQKKVTYLDGIGEKVQYHQNNGETVRSADGYHWNERGHEIVAAAIEEQLVSTSLMKSLTSSLQKK